MVLEILADNIFSSILTNYLAVCLHSEILISLIYQRSQQALSFARLTPHRLRRRLAKLRFVRGVICDFGVRAV